MMVGPLVAIAYRLFVLLPQQNLECRAPEALPDGTGFARTCYVHESAGDGSEVSEALIASGFLPHWWGVDARLELALSLRAFTVDGLTYAYSVNVHDRFSDCVPLMTAKRSILDVPPLSRRQRRLESEPWATARCPADDITSDTTLGDGLVRECISIEDGSSVVRGSTKPGIAWTEMSFPTEPNIFKPSRSIPCRQRGLENGPVTATRSYAVESTREPITGRLQTVQEFRDGFAEGAYVVLHDSGFPAILGQYVDGVAQGAWVWFAPDGAPVAGAWFELGEPEDVAVELAD